MNPCLTSCDQYLVSMERVLALERGTEKKAYVLKTLEKDLLQGNKYYPRSKEWNIVNVYMYIISCRNDKYW